MSKFKQFERYPTRNGGTALILEVYPAAVLAAVYHPSGFFVDNRRYDNRTGCLIDRTDTASCRTDLLWDILPPESEKRTVWVNVYANEDGSISPALDVHANRISCEADATIERVHGKNRPRVGCHRIELRAEFEEDA